MFSEENTENNEIPVFPFLTHYDRNLCGCRESGSSDIDYLFKILVAVELVEPF